MKLLIPGPVEVREDILKVMSEQLYTHRGQEATEIQQNIEKNLQKILNTENEILCSTSSGTGLMEAAIKSCTLKKAAVFSMGGFGDKWYEVALNNGIDVDLYRAKDGEPITPSMLKEALDKRIYDTITITHNETSTGVQNNLEELSEVYKEYKDVVVLLDTVSSCGGVRIDADKNYADIVITSTQKCLGLPPGMAFCSLSQKAKDRIFKIGKRGYYLDLITLLEFVESSHQYISTPNLSLMKATEVQLDYIVNVEGIENRFKRHEKLAKMVREFAKKHGGLFANEDYLSDTVTTINMTDCEMFEKIKKSMYDKGYFLAEGYGDLHNINFRLAHMADRTIEDMKNILDLLSDIWNKESKLSGAF